MNIITYLKTRISFIILYILIFALLVGSFALYELPVMAVVYPMGLGVLLAVIYMVMDYRREKKRYAKVLELEGRAKELSQSLSEHQAKTQERLDYINVWTHQIKTPIAAMRLTLDGEDSDLSRRLSAELNRIDAYADMVMTYLRLDSESTDYVFEHKDLDEIVRASVRRFSGEFIARKISLCYEPVNATVLTDEKWLEFVIEQILSNALKYTQSGSISIYLEEPLTLCVRDTGMGIAAEDLPRIFEQGFTGYNGRTEKKASGIGLYLCKRICDGLGYRIWAESQVGKGTVMRLDLDKGEGKACDK